MSCFKWGGARRLVDARWISSRHKVCGAYLPSAFEWIDPIWSCAKMGVYYQIVEGLRL